MPTVWGKKEAEDKLETPVQWKAMAESGGQPSGTHDKVKRGNRWPVVIIDHFTNWRDGIAMTEPTPQAVATALNERVFGHFGLPVRLYTNQGDEFESKLTNELYQL